MEQGQGRVSPEDVYTEVHTIIAVLERQRETNDATEVAGPDHHDFDSDLSPIIRIDRPLQGQWHGNLFADHRRLFRNAWVCLRQFAPPKAATSPVSG